MTSYKSYSLIALIMSQAKFIEHYILSIGKHDVVLNTYYSTTPGKLQQTPGSDWQADYAAYKTTW